DQHGDGGRRGNVAGGGCGTVDHDDAQPGGTILRYQRDGGGAGGGLGQATRGPVRRRLPRVAGSYGIRASRGAAPVIYFLEIRPRRLGVLPWRERLASSSIL